MYIRLVIYIFCAIVVFCLFLFNPAFNWGGQPGISMYQQLTRQGDILTLLMRSATPAILVFIGLLAYFGLGSRRKEK